MADRAAPGNAPDALATRAAVCQFSPRMVLLATVVALVWCAHALLGWHWRIAPRLETSGTATPGLAPREQVVAVVPARNEAAELPRTLGALLGQREDLHVILVDDDSTDGTAEVARAIAAEGDAADRLTVLAAAPLRAAGRARSGRNTRASRPRSRSVRTGSGSPTRTCATAPASSSGCSRPRSATAATWSP